MPSPLGHTLMGLTLRNRIRGGQRNDLKSFFLFALFANLPDLDFIPGLLMGDPFLFHRGAMHSVGFAALAMGVLYAVLRSLGDPFAGDWSKAVGLGVLSHLILDMFCGANGLMLLWPLSHQHFISPVPLFLPLQSGGWAEIVSWHNAMVVFTELVFFTFIFLLSRDRRPTVPTPAFSAPQDAIYQ